MAKRIQPFWIPPQGKNSVILKLFNSLTRNKEIFIPQFGNHILWYSCGPTVYDAAHMGHARSYISFDILRRVLSDYFGYNILYVMNITDIDDKIIIRARQNYLYEKYIKENHTLDKILDDAKNVMFIFEDTVKNTNDVDKKSMLQKILCNVERAIENLENAVKLKDEDKMKEFQELLLKEMRDPLAEWLDKKKGATITEHSIFTKLAQHWEVEFHKDMNSLNKMELHMRVMVLCILMLPPLINKINIIMLNLFQKHMVIHQVYKKEKVKTNFMKCYYKILIDHLFYLGDLSTLEVSEKRSANDFALWKCSKEGEPRWESPWGKGRPGWHIECSVMASIICGESLDIHSGGVDLKFPHHDNEIAQAEAYFNHSNWVKYFLHSGHLTIAGCKMSKSLKNFITVQDALKKHSARQLRLAFLLHSWKDTLDYSDNTMQMAVQYEKFLNEFFLNVKCEIRSLGTEININTFTKWTNFEVELNEKFHNARDLVHNALCDNIDTRSALDAIRDLVVHCNIYMKQIKHPNTLLLRDVAVYITKMFTIFGAISSTHNAIGFPVDSNTANLNVEEVVMPYLEVLANFREKVRNYAKTLEASSILNECDTLRDDILPNIGVRLEDSNEEVCKIKLVNREELLKEKECKMQMELEKTLEKEKKKVEAAAAAALKEAQKKIPPSEMFKLEETKYSQFDSKGLPTHDINGKEISKGQMKKLQKLQQAQEKRYNEYLASI
ncbi:Cysteine--tRNA ligase, cytoplasmic [Eufriesea mexicana]|uniref:Cysteine--tRNA ligase, cytoplasmic n=1 Tax=Eufriesea mexicana TaxID=516756 RepID=A0A310SIA1_9HYME|nr:Cysteine--tRNA ligase, cytoplasmic [Eufriesea mexicana]